MSIAPYGAHKATGVDWLGNVPEHWCVARNKSVFAEVDKRSENGEEELLTVSHITGVTPRSEKNVNMTMAETLAGYKKCRAGDLIINTMWGWMGALGTSRCDGIVSPSYNVYTIRDQTVLNPRFYDYLCRIPSHVTAIQANSTGVWASRLRIYPDVFLSMRLALPPMQEQRSIATFLDRETAKIDALVEEQKRLIELLKEKRQAVISHAVTKGLDPNAPMKDSGVEWLGEVPEHWAVAAVKTRCSTITDGAHISPDTNDGLHPFVSTRDISEGGIDLEGCLMTTSDSYDYMVRTGCKPEMGDVLFSKDGTIGRTVIVDFESDFVVASSLIILRPESRTLSASFFNWLLRSAFVSAQVDRFVKGAGLPRLSVQNLCRVIGTFPPLPEQMRIADHLDREIGKFDSLVCEATGAIDLLSERRSALISAAVTGKIDVRGVAQAQDTVAA